jgi:hypothetical protein
MDSISTPSSSEVVTAPLVGRSVADAKPRRVRRPTPALLAVRGVNGQSIPARRFREIAISLADDCGGVDKLSAPTRAMIRQAGSLMVKLEDMSTKAVAGEEIDDEQLVRLTNVLNRMLHRLGLKKTAPPKGPTPLAKFLAEKVAAKT